jgi:predicted Rossmann fold flavoprotein
MHYDVIVIGGGAAGMMAAGVAAARGKRVLLLEKNKQLGVKLALTGGGRCNITNAEMDVRALLPKYSGSEQFLYTSFATFGVADTFRFFESRGLPLVVEGHKRAFPKSQRASDVVEVLRAYMKEGGVTIKTGTSVVRVEQARGKISAVHTARERFTASAFIFATGGVSHRETGSTGDALPWFKELGHTVHDPTPTIVPLRIKEGWVKQLAGKSLKGVNIHVRVDGRKAFSKKGDVLCTHFGVSGPVILNMASKVADLLHDGAVTLALDLFPHLDIGALDAHICTIFDANKNKTVRNAAKEFLPEGTADVLLICMQGLDADKKVHSVTRVERGTMARTLKALTLSVSGLMGFDRAVVADGGVPLEEIDMRTMRSRVVNNAYITGDLLHINRPSGGYSLQLCWTTGFIAGQSV